MINQEEFGFVNPDGGDAALVKTLFDRADRILIKKLSNNDRDWSRFENKHQAGVYIPAEQREGGFFPALACKERTGSDLAEIREAYFNTLWPQAQDKETKKRTRIVHYTSKGPETHMTRLPKETFKWLAPASFLVIGRTVRSGEAVYECLTIDSASDEAVLLAEMFDLQADFTVGEFNPAEMRAIEQDRVLEFVEQVITAWLKGKIVSFAKKHAVMPTTIHLAEMARKQFIEQHGLQSLNPFDLPYPGDALREISRSVEWGLFREFQRRERSVELVRIVLGDKPRAFKPPEIIRQLVEELPAVDALMLSASQQRKSRAGYSYEHHIEAMLIDGDIPFEKQVVIEARKRPDFILPSLAFIDSGRPEAVTGLILSAKTTLRERWKQVQREMGNRKLYLTTVDENIASNAIEDMGSIGVNLIVPESLMKAKETEYGGHNNVITFRQFCSEVILPFMGKWS